jgi:AraC-like DNA-binding protein
MPRRPSLAAAPNPSGSSLFRIARECVQLRKVDHNCFLGATCDHDHGGRVGISIFFSVRNVRRDEDVVAGRGGDADSAGSVVEYELAVSASYEDRGFGFAVVVVVRRRRGRGRRRPPDLSLSGGHGAKHVIQKRVLLEAKRVLVHTALTSTTIAGHIGMADPSTFGKFFRRQTGETPASFRDRHRGVHNGD